MLSLEGLKEHPFGASFCFKCFPFLTQFFVSVVTVVFLSFRDSQVPLCSILCTIMDACSVHLISRCPWQSVTGVVFLKEFVYCVVTRRVKNLDFVLCDGCIMVVVSRM